MTKLWEKNYTLNGKIEDFTVGNDYELDKHILTYDCLASQVHARMLGKIGILNSSEVEQIVHTLEEIINLHKSGQFEIKPEDEDCHTAIESFLIKKLGNLGKKIHTGRSRNDQVLTALRLFYKDQLTSLKQNILDFVETLDIFKTRYGKVQIPGFSHSRKAMPSSICMWSSAFIESMQDNLKLLKSVFDLIDQSPLGTAAGYGVPINVEREYTAEELGFSRIQKNPVYVQNSRGKFESSIIHLNTQIMFDLNKLATDLIMFSMPEFGFFKIPDEYCTGSSIMPQKMNPDVLELLRAYYHKVIASEFQLKSQTANLISGYNRDIQLTKEPVLETFHITAKSVSIMTLIFTGIKPDLDRCEQSMTEELFATEQVYKLVQQGMSFREAYQEVSNSIRETY